MPHSNNNSSSSTSGSSSTTSSGAGGGRSDGDMKKKSAEKKTFFVCEDCGDSFGRWWGVCPSCRKGGSLKRFNLSLAPETEFGDSVVSGLAANNFQPQILSDVTQGLNEELCRFPVAWIHKNGGRLMPDSNNNSSSGTSGSSCTTTSSGGGGRGNGDMKKPAKKKTFFVCENCRSFFDQWWGVCSSCKQTGRMKRFTEPLVPETEFEGYTKAQNGWVVSGLAANNFQHQLLSDVTHGLNEEQCRFPLNTLLHCSSQMEKQSSSNTGMHSGQEKLQDDGKVKRPRQMQQSPSSSIIQLSSQLHTNIFEGDVLTRYGPALNKNATSPVKAQVLHADLIDRDGHMTITVTMKNTVIALFKEQFSPGNSVHINGFSLVNKGTYDRGDAQHCILLHETSMVQSIAQVCSERKLVPDTTINELVHSNDNYVVGSIAAIIIACNQVDNQFELALKDGDATTDTSTLILNDGFKDICVHIQQQLTMKLPPLYIFKNVVRSGARGSQIMRPGPSTFIDTLNDECAKTHLLSLIKSKTQVHGKLKAKNVYAPPFRQCCSICKKSFSGSPFCRTCKQITTPEYQHSVQCILQTAHGKTDCLLQMPLLEKYCPAIAALTFETYVAGISSTVFQLRTFQITGLFTLTIDNTISEIHIPE